jgi:hypothetical protein
MSTLASVAFMELRGYSVSSDHYLPPNQQGIEGAALIIQRGGVGRPDPDGLQE